MESVFDQFDGTLDQQIQNEIDSAPDEFFVKREMLHFGRLSVLAPDRSMAVGSFRLLEDCLVCICQPPQEDTKIATSLCWKRISPFQETLVNGEDQFGFRLIGNQKVEDFVVANEDSLDPWLQHLEKLAILTEVEEDYQFIKQIGDGAFASVHMAVSLTDRSKCAIKSIDKQTLSSPVTMNMLKTEIQTLRKINHPNVVKLHKVYEEAQKVHLVQDLAQGTNLLDLVCFQQSLDEPVVACIARQLLETIRDLNANGVVHRDMKLENVMVTPEYTIQLIDFGMCAMLTKGETEIQGICGSPGYIAPEVCTNEIYDMKIDVFSIGVVCYVMYTGTLPFNGPDIEKRLEANVQCDLRFTHRKFDECSQDMIDFLTTLICPKPEHRPTPAEALEHPWIHNTQTQSFKAQSRSFQNWMDTTESEADSAASQSRGDHAGMRHALRCPTVDVVEIMETEDYKAFQMRWRTY